ncbi:enolase C-terminal domain-like protein [Candidatus Rhabdochlamydia sp. T3358]|uniref:enolase C-terminal domain-like protein n=1 Tax=Candidatus Rhabdochlamydia sp. T3358 TaxID=2099795 RepID=UPI0010B8F436|nr:enolase C-terminal domain-like protein [Candidatus Rhabdochlamydia sp. T3358]VHO03207.1 o-succinylbenzoate synthase [Candidatus Rhabdochlamydia sp. T3358]
MSIYSSFLHRLDVISWRIFRFQLTKKDRSTRLSHVVCLKDSNHQEAWAEISPFPGRSKETTDEALLQLINVLKGKKPSYLYPSVSFALATALKHLSFPPIPICALLSGSKQEIIQQALLAEQKGFSSVKVKISQLPLEDAFTVLDQLRKIFSLRVDANQRFSFQEALYFFGQFPSLAFDFIEEPTWETSRLADFSHPFGLDETLEKKPDFMFENLVNCKAIVVKPMIQGFFTTKKLMKRLGKKRIKLIFSSCYESGLGLMQIAHLAIQTKLYPLGLNTQSLFTEDLLTPFPIFSSPICSCPFPAQIQTHLLQEIYHG